MHGFEIIYTEYFRDVYNYVYSLCRNESLAEELTQEAFYKALQHLDRFDGKCRLYVWLCQIARNTYFTYLKKQRRQVPADTLGWIPVQDVSLETQFIEQDTAKRIYILAQHLSEPYREVFMLRVFGELPYARIGQLYEKSDSWARLIFHRAKKEIRRKLHEDEL